MSTPQDVALMDARRGVKMFSQVNVPVYPLPSVTEFVFHSFHSNIFAEHGVLTP